MAVTTSIVIPCDFGGSCICKMLEKEQKVLGTRLIMNKYENVAADVVAVAVENVACGAGRRGRRIDVAVETVVCVCGAGRRGRWTDVAAADVAALARWRRS